MEHDVLAPLRAILGFDLADLAGAEVSVRVPLADVLVNRLVADQLSRHNAPVSRLQIHALDGDVLEAHVSVRKFPLLPSMRVLLHIERQPRPDDPVLSVRWSLPSLGPLASVAGPLVASFRDLPPELRIEGDRLLVNIRDAAAARGLLAVLDYLTDLQVHTRAGALMVHANLRVPAA